jgi:WhiB family transcriptional regulator, redox-sensing transcriptional regulator
VPRGTRIRNVTDSIQSVPVRHARCDARLVEELSVSSFPRPSLTLLTHDDFSVDMTGDYSVDPYPADTWTAPAPAAVAAGDEGWRLDALCAETDPEAFFPEKGGSTREAKRVCSGCAVRAECLEYALESDERFGIWGGLSERERRRVRLARRALSA